jgi:hypothetical protein
MVMHLRPGIASYSASCRIGTVGRGKVGVVKAQEFRHQKVRSGEAYTGETNIPLRRPAESQESFIKYVTA